MPSMRSTIKQIYRFFEIKGKVHTTVRLEFVCVRWEREEWELAFERRTFNGAEQGAADDCHF